LKNINYYSDHSVFSYPGVYLNIYQKIPHNIILLRDYCSRFFLHAKLASAEYINEFYDSICFYNTRSIQTFLRYKFSNNFHLDYKKRNCNRPVGICRDSALLMCSILRSRKIPARLRVGFASYYHDRFWVDGFALELYNEMLKRWNVVDVAINDEIFSKFNISKKINFNCLSASDFMTASQAWVMIRQDRINPILFRSGNYFGLSIVRNRMIQDLFCLLKIEPLLWDLWGIMLSIEKNNVNFFDKLANLLINYDDDVKILTDFLDLNPAIQITDEILEDSPNLPSKWLTKADFYAQY